MFITKVVAESAFLVGLVRCRVKKFLSRDYVLTLPLVSGINGNAFVICKGKYFLPKKVGRGG